MRFGERARGRAQLRVQRSIAMESIDFAREFVRTIRCHEQPGVITARQKFGNPAYC